MNVPKLTLIVSDKPDVERDKVCDVWVASVGPVLRLGRFWEPPLVDPNSVRIYGAETFALVLAQILEIRLISPSDDLIFDVPEQFLKRKVSKKSLSSIAELGFPVFCKSIVPKQFEAKVYDCQEQLADACSGLEGTTELLVSEIVAIEAEARFFVCDDMVATCAVYEGSMDLEKASVFVYDLINAIRLPRTVVIDVGLLSNNTLCVVEFNASWGSGLNGCSAVGAAKCIERAVVAGS